MHISDLIPWGRDKKQAPPQEDNRAVNPMVSLQRDINHVFDDFWRKVESDWNGGDAVGMSGPSTDITETEKSIDVSIELPGMTEKDIDISLSSNAMTIRGEKKVEHEEERKGIYMSERSYGSFYRTVPLPAGVDPDKADAKFKNGVLTVSLPKTAEAQANIKRIPVKAA
ncbi:Hsp20/alpha crystallin family protein [Yoonia sediminilitoris]|uniref:HSP20 family protein n=1 Tax=Yoonia sediminilitoris TaxID=1286148 RepID=A0A2T6KC24_9RHOB|nr:Hsp20/alpha crystallin family protein [Yoonia sediminilitoris]PUB12435.1 HSP20 family protein [Yoonia sediminilitoris]RCW93129.1 HSP20 family protein [Yoonia sediminilitoris]